MRYLPLVLAIGCTVTDPDLREPSESMAVEAVAVCGYGWCVEASPRAVQLSSVWAVSPDDVFAVGDGGTILHRTDDVWTVMDSGTSCKLRGVWGMSASDVWAVGEKGTILHFDGTAWSAATAVTTSVDLSAVWGSSSSDVFFAGQGAILHLGASVVTPNNFGGLLLSLSGTGPRDVWAVGESTGLRHFDGSTWQLTPTGTGTNSFNAVVAIAANDVWISDMLSGKETAHGPGTPWATARTVAGGVFYGLSALAANDVWGVGTRYVGHWTGTSWSMEAPFPAGTMLRSVTTTPGNAWVVGSGGLIAHRSLW